MKHWGEDIAVGEYMVAPVHTAHQSERLAAADARMRELGVSALPVVDDTGQLGGVITTSDLLRIGRMKARGGRRRTLVLPDSRVGEHMTSPVEVTSATASLAEAARRMVKRHVHRLYVTHTRRVDGVLTTRDLMLAVADARVRDPVRDMVSGSVVAVRSQDPISLAIDRLLASHHRTLVVVEDGWPVGVFAQREALAAKDAPSGTPIDEWMTPALVCVAPDFPAYRAAARAAATGARAVLVTDGPEILGVLTGFDFAGLVARER